jgi:NTE family protein
MSEITLALGGGGVKGFTHLGVLKTLEKEGFKIKAIAGTSAGGIVGAVYAAGLDLSVISKDLANLNKRKFFSRQPTDGPSMLGVTGLIEWLIEYLEDRTFQDLNIPFAVTAVDIKSKQEYILRQGLVRDAVLATTAIPGVFPPKQIGNTCLVDGGVLDPVPIAVARWLEPKSPVVAVCLTPTPEKWSELPPFSAPDTLPFPSQIRKRIGQLRYSQALQLFIDSNELTSHMVAETRMQLEKPDVIIRPEVNHVGILDQVNPQELIKIGEAAAKGALSEIHHSLSWHHQLPRRFKDPAPPGVVLSDSDPNAD